MTNDAPISCFTILTMFVVRRRRRDTPPTDQRERERERERESVTSEMAAPIYGRLEKCVLSAGKPMPIKFLVLRGGGIFWDFGGRGREFRFYLYGREDFLRVRRTDPFLFMGVGCAPLSLRKPVTCCGSLRSPKSAHLLQKHCRVTLFRYSLSPYGSFRNTQTLKTLTSLSKGVRSFFLGDDSIWSFPSVSSLSDYSIWRS